MNGSYKQMADPHLQRSRYIKRKEKGEKGNE